VLLSIEIQSLLVLLPLQVRRLTAEQLYTAVLADAEQKWVELPGIDEVQDILSTTIWWVLSRVSILACHVDLMDLLVTLLCM
jgi:hypothetical protein